jgi:hypothetical protein
VFVCVSNVEFLGARWDLCGRVTEGVVNGLLLVMVLLLLVIYCDGIRVCTSAVYGGIWLY